MTLFVIPTVTSNCNCHFLIVSQNNILTVYYVPGTRETDESRHAPYATWSLIIQREEREITTVVMCVEKYTVQ